MARYINYFMKLNCAGDVLNSINPTRKHEASISKAVSLMKKIRPMVLKSPNKFEIVQITDDNGMAAILMAHVLPIKNVTVYSTKKSSNLIGRVNKITWRHNILPNPTEITQNTIIIATGNVDYNKVIDIYLKSSCINIITLPNITSMQCNCIADNVFDVFVFPPKSLRKYLYLREKLQGKIYADNNIDYGDNIIVSSLDASRKLGCIHHKCPKKL